MKKKQLKISVITLFPEFIKSYSQFGIVARAVANRILRIVEIDLRTFGVGSRQTVDHPPYGGGVGMVLRADVVIKAIKRAKNKFRTAKTRVILMTPRGKQFNQKTAIRLSKYDHLVLVSGRYEGFDERVSKYINEELSVGDYVLMGGELPALVISEAVMRHVPGILGKDESAHNESFSDGLLEHPQYTKPEVLEIDGTKSRVPKVLLSGHHAKIEEWRREQALKKTKKNRPDLIK
ncbi:MAG: tRNA (guanosine(37)-N1)-methyltransferase TrmD [Candidatus Doudnabacteria bacterium]